MASPPRDVVPATLGHAFRLAANLAPDHVREIADTGKLDATASLLISMNVSLEAHTYAPDGEPVFMMGVERAAALTGSALVWMLGTEAIRRHPAGTLRAARWGVGRAFAVTGAERVEQYIPDWYETGLRFVARLGFRVEAAGLKTHGGDPLSRVVLERKEWSWGPQGPYSTRPFRP